MNDDALNAVLGVFLARFDKITSKYLKQVGEHLRAIGTLTAKDVHIMTELKKQGVNVARIKQEIADACYWSIAQLDDVLTTVAHDDYRIDKSWITGTPQTAQSVSHEIAIDNVLKERIRAQYEITAGTMMNLSQTTVVDTAYRNAVDDAVHAVSSGVTDYNSAIAGAVKKCAQSGLKVVYESGYTRRVDSAARQNILDGVRSINRECLTHTGEKFGADGVQISAHALCAPDHLPYQGKLYSKAEFQTIQDSLPREFGMWNCRHILYPAIIGVSKPLYSEETLKKYADTSNEQIEIGGRSLTRYQWTQEQRKLETKLRDARSLATLAEAAGNKDVADKANTDVRNLTNVYNTISKAAGLIPKMERTIPKA